VTLPSRTDLTFAANASLGRHGWLRLTPAYAAPLVSDLLADAPPGTRVLDPFGGTGTTALLAAQRGLACETVEINPFLCWLVHAKTATYSAGDLRGFEHASDFVARAIRDENGPASDPPALYRIDRWWRLPVLTALGRAAGAIGIGAPEDAGSPVGTWPRPVRDLLCIAFCRAMIETARVTFGHQSMSFREDRGATTVAEVVGAWVRACREIATSAGENIPGTVTVHEGDARSLTAVAPGSIDRVVTSPPYCNRMSYVRELRPYMYWLGFLHDGRAAGELDWQAIGGTWGAATSRLTKWEAAGPGRVPWLDAIVAGIEAKSPLCARYVARYAEDVAAHVDALVKVLAPGCRVSYVVGNSLFFGALVEVERVYAELFAQAGLVDVGVRTIRRRSSKKGLYEFVVEARRVG
jgi:hypothetical protein